MAGGGEAGHLCTRGPFRLQHASLTPAEESPGRGRTAFLVIAGWGQVGAFVREMAPFPVGRAVSGDGCTYLKGRLLGVGCTRLEVHAFMQTAV